MHSHTDCPGCKRPLTYFTEGVLAGEWRADEVTERERRQLADEYTGDRGSSHRPSFG